ncbi:MAG: helix-turn-helix domain-containing protein [Planctomycetota bacterium]
MARAFLTSKEVSELLKIDQKRLLRWSKRGRFPSAILLPTGEVRFDKDALEQWLGEQAAQGGKGGDNEPR